MGFCLDTEHGMFSTEARSDSFTIHFETYDPPRVYRFVKGQQHPEFLWEDLDDLIHALQELKAYARERHIQTSHPK